MPHQESMEDVVRRLYVRAASMFGEVMLQEAIGLHQTLSLSLSKDQQLRLAALIIVGDDVEEVAWHPAAKGWFYTPVVQTEDSDQLLRPVDAIRHHLFKEVFAAADQLIERCRSE